MTDTKEKAREVIEQAVEAELFRSSFHSVTITSAILAALAEAGLFIAPIKAPEDALQYASRQRPTQLLAEAIWATIGEHIRAGGKPATPHGSRRP